ncbi:MAG: LuxR C-terminal-related transcriptional regulator [Acidobacteriaceae bacterium]
MRPRLVFPGCLAPDEALSDLNGLDLQTHLAPERTDLPIIFIMGYGDVRTSDQATEGDADEFPMKPFEHDVLLAAIQESLDRIRVALAREIEMRTLRVRYATLNRCERQVMALVVSGLLTQQVGGELDIRETSVKAHRDGVMQKMQAQSFADLVKIAIRLGPHRALNRSNSAHLVV